MLSSSFLQELQIMMLFLFLQLFFVCFMVTSLCILPRACYLHGSLFRLLAHLVAVMKRSSGPCQHKERGRQFGVLLYGFPFIFDIMEGLVFYLCNLALSFSQHKFPFSSRFTF